MSLLKLTGQKFGKLTIIDLHSTMSLLKQFIHILPVMVYRHLHSTMSLLKLNFCAETQLIVYKFTFHYVTIKTNERDKNIQVFYNLHSTMSLLKRYPLNLRASRLVVFTFHYVTIKTQT